MNVQSILKTFVRNENNRQVLLKYLQSLSETEEVQKFMLYEAFSHGEKADVVRILKEKEFMFLHKDFTDIHNLVREQEEFLTNPIQVEDGVIECNRCKSHKTFSYAKQTRASDEGTTVFVTCAECKFQFRL